MNNAKFNLKKKSIFLPILPQGPRTKENRIYIRGEFTRKKV